MPFIVTFIAHIIHFNVFLSSKCVNTIFMRQSTGNSKIQYWTQNHNQTELWQFHFAWKKKISLPKNFDVITYIGIAGNSSISWFKNLWSSLFCDSAILAPILWSLAISWFSKKKLKKKSKYFYSNFSSFFHRARNCVH